MTMEYITATHLRTKSSQLISYLQKGMSVSLIHRSKIVGIIKPNTTLTAGPINVEELRKFLNKAKPKKIIPRSQREKIYRQHMMEKYGKGLSRR